MTTWQIREQRENEIDRLKNKDDILSTFYYFVNGIAIFSLCIILIFAYASYKTEYIDYNPGFIDWHNVVVVCGSCLVVAAISGVTSLVLLRFRTAARNKCKTLRAANNGDRGLDRPW